MATGIPSLQIARYAGAAVALAIFLLISALYLWAPFEVYMWVVRHYATNPYELPFLDSAGSLAALECARRGIDVVVRDPCDILERAYHYGPIWMSLSWLPLYMHHHFWFGWLTGALFLASFAWLPVAPRTWRAVVITVLASTSNSVAYAVERGNPDIWIFVAVIGVVACLLRGMAARGNGYALAWFLAAFKYYPLVVLVLVLRERPKVALGIGACLLLATAGYIKIYFGDIIRGLPLVPVDGPDTGMIGAGNLPKLLEMLVSSLAPGGYDAGWVGLPARIGAACAMLAGTVSLIAHWCRRPTFVAALVDQEAPRQMLLVAGAALMVGCFFAGQSIPYRAIFLLLALPGILALGAGQFEHPVARTRDNLAGLAVFLLWEPLIRESLFEELSIIGLPMPWDVSVRIAYLLLRELAWWWMIAFLASTLVIFIARAPLAGCIWRPRISI